MIVPVGALAALLCAPLLVETWRAYGGSLELMSGSDSREAMFLWRNRLAQFVLPPTSALGSGLLSSALIGAGVPTVPHPAPFLGWTTLVLAFLGWRTRRRGTGFLAAVAIVFIVLSCGPVISVLDAPVSSIDAHGNPTPLSGPGWIPGPFLLVKDLPILGSMRVPGRFVTTAQLALGFLAGYGALALLRRGPFRRFRLATVALLALLHFNVNTWPVRYAPEQSIAYWSQIAAEPGDFTVLDVPYARGVHQYMHYGAYHRHEVAWGFGSRVPDAQLRELEQAFEFPGIGSAFTADLGTPDVVRFARSLRERNVRYVIFHKLHLELRADTLSHLAAEDPSLLEYAPKLYSLWDNADTWAAQDAIAPPRLVFDDARARVYLIEPR
jgi:hypothetical protein